MHESATRSKTIILYLLDFNFYLAILVAVQMHGAHVSVESEREIYVHIFVKYALHAGQSLLLHVVARHECTLFICASRRKIIYTAVIIPLLRFPAFNIFSHNDTRNLSMKQTKLQLFLCAAGSSKRLQNPIGMLLRTKQQSITC